MSINGTTASYDYTVTNDEPVGNWPYTCEISARGQKATGSSDFVVAASSTTDPATPPDVITDPPTTPDVTTDPTPAPDVPP